MCQEQTRPWAKVYCLTWAEWYHVKDPNASDPQDWQSLLVGWGSKRSNNIFLQFVCNCCQCIQQQWTTVSSSQRTAHWEHSDAETSYLDWLTPLPVLCTIKAQVPGCAAQLILLPQNEHILPNLKWGRLLSSFISFLPQSRSWDQVVLRAAVLYPRSF